MLHPTQGNREVTPSSTRETLSDITTQDTKDVIKGGRKRRKHHLQGTTTDGNNGEVGTPKLTGMLEIPMTNYNRPGC
jgi:hypothetical protein